MRILTPLLRWIITITVILGAILVAVLLWRRYESDPWTRDGHILVDVVRVAPDVGGLVTSVHVRDNQLVRRGQLLFVIDLPRYADAMAQARANVGSARASLAVARKVERRDLALGDLVATETHEENVARVQTAQAALDQVLAALNTAELNVHRTEVRASVDGIATNVVLHPGDFIATGSQALALTDIRSIRVEGYFEETRLKRIPIGARAIMHLMGDSRPMYGHVVSMAAAIADDQSSTTTNQIRSVNPTFTWVRLAQRIPVRIQIDRLPVGTRLIAGRTVTVTIVPTPAEGGPRPGNEVASPPASAPAEAASPAAVTAR